MSTEIENTDFRKIYYLLEMKTYIRSTEFGIFNARNDYIKSGIFSFKKHVKKNLKKNKDQFPLLFECWNCPKNVMKSTSFRFSRLGIYQ